MCGIFGFASGEGNKNSRTRAETFANGLLFNLPRGWDSTGIAAIKESGKNQNTVALYKRALHVVDYLGAKATKKILDNFDNYHFGIGHCRASTRGSSTDLNAHPFQYEHITLAHNGTVNQTILPNKAEEFVDSADICASMAKSGEKETLEKLDGAYALVWYNQNDDTLNLARNKRKPLAFAFVDKENTMYYGSEWATLFATMIRNNEPVDGKILIPKPFHWYKFHKEDLRKYEVKEFKEYEYPTYGRHHNQSQNGARNGWGEDGPNENTSRPPIIVHLPRESTNIGDKGDKPTTIESTGEITTIDADGEAQGVPKTSSRLKFVAQFLKGRGLDIGRLTMIRPHKWVPYKNQQDRRGYVEGTRLEYPHTPVLVYNVSNVDWNIYTKRDKMAVRTVNVRMNYEKDGQHAIVAIVDPRWNIFMIKEVSKSDENKPPEAVSAPREEAGGKEVPIEKTPSLPVLLRGPNGTLVSRERWDRLVSDGCGGCTQPISPNTHLQVIWLGDCAVCASCCNSDLVRESLGIIDPLQSALMH